MNWHRYKKEENEEEADSIPFQVQKLFAKLQLHLQPYVGTKELTKSFDWDSEMFVQQDVQEFCRVFLDAIEQTLKGTPVENIISDLFQGFLRMLKCKFIQGSIAAMFNARNVNLRAKGKKPIWTAFSQ